MFNWLRKLFNTAISRKKEDEKWANLHNQTPGTSNNNLPLEPEKDPWRT